MHRLISGPSSPYVHSQPFYTDKPVLVSSQFAYKSVCMQLALRCQTILAHHDYLD